MIPKVCSIAILHCDWKKLNASWLMESEVPGKGTSTLSEAGYAASPRMKWPGGKDLVEPRKLEGGAVILAARAVHRPRDDPVLRVTDTLHTL